MQDGIMEVVDVSEEPEQPAKLLQIVVEPKQKSPPKAKNQEKEKENEKKLEEATGEQPLDVEEYYDEEYDD